MHVVATIYIYIPSAVAATTATYMYIHAPSLTTHAT